MSSYSKHLDWLEKWVANKRESKYHFKKDVFWKEYSCYQTWSWIQTIESAIPKFECHTAIMKFLEDLPNIVFHKNHLHHYRHCYKEPNEMFKRCVSGEIDFSENLTIPVKFELQSLTTLVPPASNSILESSNIMVRKTTLLTFQMIINMTSYLLIMLLRT